MNERKRDGRAFVLIALLCIAGTTFMTGCGGDDGDEKPAPPPPTPTQQGSPMPLSK